MILVVLAFLILAAIRVIGEIYFERAFPKRTLPLFAVFVAIMFYALTNL